MKNVIEQIIEIWTGHQNMTYKYSALSALIGVAGYQDTPEVASEIIKLNQITSKLEYLERLSRACRDIADKDKRVVIDIREPHREHAIAEQLHINPVIHESSTPDPLAVFEMLSTAEKELPSLLPNVSLIISSVMAAQPGAQPDLRDNAAQSG